MTPHRRRGIPAFAVDRAAEVFIAAAPESVRARLAGEPTVVFAPLLLQLTEDRGVKGWRWRVAEPFAGSAEIFLRPELDGCRVHAFVRAEAATTAATLDRLMAAVRRRLFVLKDDVEADRPAGAPAIG